MIQAYCKIYAYHDNILPIDDIYIYIYKEQSTMHQSTKPTLHCTIDCR